MVNVEKFIKRLEIILDYYNLTASSFADKINVQRSSLSHLLSGRNKPSLEFIMKIVDEFPDVTLEWIINGYGKFPKEEIVFQEIAKIETPKIEVQKPDEIESFKKVDLFSEPNSEPNSESSYEQAESKNSVSEVSKIENHVPTPSTHDEIKQIVIFYKNGTFKNYNP